MKSKTTTTLLSLSFVFLPIVAKAESAQPTATPSQLYSSSSNSSFQNAAFSQSGASGATTASGSASTLLNTPSSSLSVSDGPKDAPTKVATKTKSSYVVYLYGLMAFSILGFLATFRKKRNTPQVTEVEESAIIVKKPKKQKKKRRNKKHHR